MRKWVVALVVVVLALVAAGFLFSRGGSGPQSAILSKADESPFGRGGLPDFAGSYDDGGGEAAGDGAEESLAAAAESADRAAAELQVPALPLTEVPEVLPGSARVIKNIALDIEIEEGRFQSQFARVSTIAEQLQGFVSASRVSTTAEGELSSGTITLRVPADRFERAVAQIKELGKVTGETRSGQDVTREFIDLEARLRHARTEEAFYVQLMSEAKSVGDMIQVQSQLSQVQLRIEEIQGQLQYLKDQTSYSTLTVSIYEPGAEKLGEPQPLAKAWQEAVDGFQTVVSGAVVALGWLAPFALLALLGFGVLRSRRAKTRSAASDASAGAGEGNRTPA